MGAKSKLVASFILCLAIVITSVFSAEAAASSTEATVFVYPDTISTTVNSTFQLFINVSAASGLQAFDFMLTYNSTLLNCSNIAEGNLLPQFGPTFIVKNDINNSIAPGLGRVWFVDVIYGVGCTDGRNGTLATITFEALTEGQTVLDLFSSNPLRANTVKLSTCPGEVIANIAKDGLVSVGPQIETSDSQLSIGRQSLSITADLNGDGLVNIEDLAIVAAAFGGKIDYERYSPRADVDQNGVIDIRDVSLVACHYLGE